MNINGVNLNLLSAFAALFEERNVTRAALRVGVTQPALSNTLAQLRRLFADPLFLRSRAGLLPTPRAAALAEPIAQGLKLLQSALSDPAFDPASSERRFLLAASDYVELVLLPALLQRLALVAPKVRLQIKPWGRHDPPPELARGELDLMIGFSERLPSRHREQLLFEDEYVCVLRRDHPRAPARLSLDRYLELSHVLVSAELDGAGSVDKALAKLGKQRRIGARVSHFLTVPWVVSQTDLMAALDRRVARVFAAPFGLSVFPPPLRLPRGQVSQVWHESVDADPAHRWFRELVHDVARSLDGGAPRRAPARRTGGLKVTASGTARAKNT